MNNIFGIFCKEKSVLPIKNEIITIYLFDKANYLRYLQQMRHNKNRVIVYSSCDETSDMNLDKKQNAEEKNIVVESFLITRFLSFYVLLNKKINREVTFFVQHLCVVRGLQITSLNQDITPWHIYRCLNIYSNYKLVFIQLTDHNFIFQLVFNDIKRILINPILSIVDIITLSQVRNSVSQNCLSFAKWISFVSEIFIFQMDEDGEDMLTKIKETDIFRKQKPGALSFFKKQYKYKEDFTFLPFRYLQKQTYLVLRLSAFSCLIFVFFKNNQQLKSESNLPKLTYIISNSNVNDKEIVHESSWKKKINQNFVIQDSNQFTTILKSCHNSNIVKPCFSDRARIVNLWNAGKFKTHLKSKLGNNQFNYHFLSDQLDSYFYDKKNENYISQIFKNYGILNEETSNVIKTGEYDYNNLDNLYIKYVPKITNIKVGKYAYLFFDEINKLKEKYLNIEEQSVIKKLSQKINSLNLILDKYLKIHFILNKIKLLLNEKNIKIYKIENKDFSNNYIKEYSIKNPILNKTIFLDENSSKNISMLFIEQNCNYLIHISRNMISHWFNIYSEFIKKNFECVHHEYKYITNLVDINEEIFLLDKYPSYNLKKYNLLFNQKRFMDSCDKNDVKDLSPFQVLRYFNKQKKIVNEFELYSRNNSSFLEELNILDTIHFASETYSNSNVIHHIDEILVNMIPLCYVEFLDKSHAFDQSTYNKFIILGKNEFENVKDKIRQCISNEKVQFHLVWNTIKKYSDNYNINNFHWINETNKNDIAILDEELPSYARKLISIKNTNLFKKNSNLFLNWQNQYLMDQMYPLNSLELWESLTKTFIKTLKIKSLHLTNTDIRIDNNLLLTDIKRKLVLDNYKSSSISIYNNYIHNQIQVIKQYISWFFTLEWWSLLQTSGKKIWSIIVQDIFDYIYSLSIDMQNSFKNKSGIFQNKFDSLPEKDNQIYQMFNFVNLIVCKQLEINKPHAILSIWENTHFSSFRMNLLSSYVSIWSFFSCYWFSLLVGGSSFFLWIMFERVRTLTDLSWNTELDLLVLRHLTGRMTMYESSKSRKKKKNKLKEQYGLSLQYASVWLRLFLSNHISHRIPTIWLYDTGTSDVYEDRRDLAFEVIVGNQSLLGLTLSDLDDKLSFDYGYASLKQEGLDYLKQLTYSHFKWYKSVNDNFLHSQRFISFAFYKAHNNSFDLWYKDKSELIKQDNLPISLELSHLYSRAILLIGPEDTGKSYLAKSFAADSHLPLVYFPINKLIDVLEFEDETLEGDSSFYFLRENFLKFKTISQFIKNMDSCIVWIPSIDDVYKCNYHPSKTKELCIALILRFFLRDMTSYLKINPNIRFIGSCEDTSYLDPSFVSMERFNRFIHVRMPSNIRRPTIFTNFLKNKIVLNCGHSWSSEFSNSTMGFTLRDLKALSNEALLISLSQQKKTFKLEDIRLVLYRGLRASENVFSTNIVQNNEALQYKIGRAILQTTLVRPNPMIPLRAKYDLWKIRFYYLSKAYLQPDSNESTVTQFNILPHILSCVAGLAAQDAWLFSTKQTFTENLYDINIEVSQDIDLAINLFQSIFKEFASLDILTSHNENLFHPEFHKMGKFFSIDEANNVIQNAYDLYHSDNTRNYGKMLSSEHLLESLLFGISSSVREERLRLSRNILFDVFKRVDEPLSLFSVVRSFGNLPYMNDSFERKQLYRSIYHISWDIMKSYIPKDLDFVFYGMLLKQRIDILDFPKDSSNLIEHEPPDSNLLLFGGRPLVNPAAVGLRHIVFRERDLFPNEELLSILYLMYQAQQEVSLMPKKRRKTDLWTPDLYLERIAMEKQLEEEEQEEEDSENKKLIEIDQTFHMFRHWANAHAIFQRPQAECPNNSEMSFLKRFISPNRFSRFSFIEDLFTQDYVLKDNNLKLQEFLTYASILESYHFLFKFFIKNQIFIQNLTNILIEKGILYEEDLQQIISKYFNNEQP